MGYSNLSADYNNLPMGNSVADLDAQAGNQVPPNQYIQKPMFNDDPAYTKYADSVLSANKNKNFVQRYLYPDKFPTIQTNKIAGNDNKGKPFSSYPDDESSTHLMAYDPKSKRVYPEVVQLPNGQLKHLSGDEAYDYADKTGEYIKFPTAEAAAKFADNGYKRGNQYIKSKSKDISQQQLKKNIINFKLQQSQTPNQNLGLDVGMGY